MVKNILEIYRRRMRRAKHLAFYFSLIPVLCARILIFWTGKMPSTVAGICFIGYKVCYLIAVVLFIIGRKIYTKLDLITLLLILLESLLVLMALFIWLAFELSDGPSF